MTSVLMTICRFFFSQCRKINLTFKRYPGEHEWKVWRHSLADMAPLLFR